MTLKSVVYKPYVLAASLLCLAIGQCKDFEDCRSLYTSQVMIELLPNNKDSAQKPPFSSITPENIVGVNDSTKPYPNPFPIFLNPAADSTSLYFHRFTPIARIDTVTIYYQRCLSLISPRCGAQQEYVLDSVYTTFAGDSIINKALRSEVNQQKTADVQIFY